MGSSRGSSGRRHSAFFLAPSVLGWADPGTNTTDLGSSDQGGRDSDREWRSAGAMPKGRGQWQGVTTGWGEDRGDGDNDREWWPAGVAPREAGTSVKCG